MITIHNADDIAAFLSQPLDPNLQHIIEQRIEQLTGYGHPLEDLARFHLVQPPDDMPTIEATIGFPIATNFVDGITYDDPDFVPSWEWLKDHGGWFELVFVLSDDGFGHVFLVPDEQGIDARLLELCRRYTAEQHSAE